MGTRTKTPVTPARKLLEVDADIHAGLKRQALDEGRAMRTITNELIRAYLTKKEAKARVA